MAIFPKSSGSRILASTSVTKNPEACVLNVPKKFQANAFSPCDFNDEIGCPNSFVSTIIE